MRKKKLTLVEVEKGVFVLRLRDRVLVLEEVSKEELGRGGVLPFEWKDLRVHPVTGELGVIRWVKGKRKFIKVKSLNFSGRVAFRESVLEEEWKKLRFERELRYLVEEVGVFDKDVLLEEKGKWYRTMGEWNFLKRKIRLNPLVVRERKKLGWVLGHEVGHALWDTIDLNLTRFHIIRERLKRVMVKEGVLGAKELKQLELLSKVLHSEMMDLYHWYLDDAARKVFRKKYLDLSAKQTERLVERIAWDIGRYLKGEKTYFRMTPLFVRRSLAWVRLVRTLLKRYH